jgi:AcrR family transcriptional regulator
MVRRGTDIEPKALEGDRYDAPVAPRTSGKIVLSSRRPRSISRREELLAIAARLFAERGFSGVTVDDIGAAAGISGPALYHHFRNKEAILGEMLVAISEHLLSQGEQTLERHADPAAALDALIRDHTDFSVDHPELITVHFRDLVNAPEGDKRRVRSLQSRYVQCWVDTLLLRSPGLDPQEARAAVHAVLGLMNSTPYTGRLRRDDTLALLRRMAADSLAGLAGPPD